MSCVFRNTAAAISLCQMVSYSQQRKNWKLKSVSVTSWSLVNAVVRFPSIIFMLDCEDARWKCSVDFFFFFVVCLLWKIEVDMHQKGRLIPFVAFEKCDQFSPTG